MKKKIIIGLSIFVMFFLVGGIYIITTTETVTSRLNNLIKLHQVEILREHLLIQIKRVQSNLYLKNTLNAMTIDTVIADVRNMEDLVETCFSCHHSKNELERLKSLRLKIWEYKDSLSRVMTIRANISRLETEEENAFKIGERLIARVNNMISTTNLRLDAKTTSVLREVAHTKIILYILVASGPLAIAVLAIILIKGFTKPVSALLDATRKLKGGNLDYRIEDLKDEFGEVAASFNEMAGSLKEQMFKMQRTEQMVVLGELAAGLAHEIKNPLAGIKVSVEVLSKELNISKEDRAVVLKVINEVKRIELLMNSLLNFAKPSKPQLAVVDMNDLIDKTVAFSLKHPSLSSNTSTKISVSKDFDKRLPETMADPMQLQQAFLNLLLNAIDAMQDGGTLAVKTSYAAEVNAIQIDISDTGRGIDEKVIDKIFQPFFTTKSKGTGLGLAITKRLIEQHAGDICVENKPDRGTIFHISLPVERVEKGQTT
jgi:signal transduction histidine kinase